MEGPRHQRLHREWQEPLEEPSSALQAGWCSPCAAHLRPTIRRKTTKVNARLPVSRNLDTLSKELPTRNVEERQHLLEQVLRRHALRVGLCFIAMFKKPSTSSAPFSAAPGFRRMKMDTFNNNWRRRWWWWWWRRRRRRRRRWWLLLCVVGSLHLDALEKTSSAPKGKRFGAARVYLACRPRAAWGRHACVGRV